MRLEQILEDGDHALLHMERYVDEGTRTYSRYASRSEVAPRYQPRSHEPDFELITVRVPRERVEIFQGAPSELADLYVRGDHVRFAIHPEAWTRDDVEHIEALRALPRDEPLRVAPTASTRTVLVVDGRVPPHFLKLHCPRRISRFNRQLRRHNIHNSVVVANELAEIAREVQRLAYLPDALGFSYGGDDRAWGFLVRERSPAPRGTDLVIPCFALFGGDLAHPTDPPLVVQLIERSGADPQAFVIDQIAIPLVECWAKVAHERGILLESHAQNTLLELDHQLRPRRIVHRDFDVWIDGEARRHRGLAAPFLDAQVGLGSGRAREPYYSLIYDRFVGHELLDYLIAAVARFHPIDRDEVRRRVGEAFHRAFPDAAERFPADTMFYFADAPQPDDHFALVDLRRPPEWRYASVIR
ncbi:MAG: IucA/IucC family C-terminal-domain containing protein [Kofleriaceae bacterium]